jgi:ribosomal protein S9
VWFVGHFSDLWDWAADYWTPQGDWRTSARSLKEGLCVVLWTLRQALKHQLRTGTDKGSNVKGGGNTGQVEAIRLAISRALVEINADYKPLLKAEGLMTRDPRMVERKKPGQPKARKQFQFSKR